MNSVRIVKNAEGVSGVTLSNGCILQIETLEQKVNGFNMQKYYMYNLEKNTKVEIASNIIKQNAVMIKNIDKHPEYVYFANSYVDEEKMLEIRIFRYSIKDKICKNIYTIRDDFEKYEINQRTRLYILNEFYMIIQNEILRTSKDGEYKDYFDFNLFMYNIFQDETIEIKDESITRNGISDIVLVSENVCAIKLGYSLLKNDRYKKLDKDEVSVESVSIVNLGQLVSDIVIEKTNIVMNTIEQTYYTKTINNFKVYGDYLIYSAFDFETFEESIVYYSYKLKESYTCIVKNEDEKISPAKTIVFNKKPYVLVFKDNEVEFYNIIDKKIDFVFNSGDKFEIAVADVIIGSTTKKGMFGMVRDYIDIYQYPGMSLVHTEKGKFIGCISDGNGKIFVLTRKD